jgi:putative copper export protein
MVKQFAEWLSTTSPSVFIQNHNSWVIPAIQSIHIIGIGVVLGSVFMIYLRILGWAGLDQTLRQTTDRFGPWLTGALYLMLATGVLMVIGEPVRELVTFSFWLKMFLVAVSTLFVITFQISLR